MRQWRLRLKSSLPGKKQNMHAKQHRLFFFEIDRIEKILSRFDPGSDISQINHLKPGEAVLVGIDVFSCLQTALNVYEETGGAFDVTIGSLMKCYRDEEGHSLQPTEAIRHEALQRVNMKHLILQEYFNENEKSNSNDDQEKTSITPRYFSVGICPQLKEMNDAGIEIDLGGIGKGYALDKIREILDDWDIDSALVHSGTSTVYAIGSSSQGAEDIADHELGWPVGVGGEWGKKVGLETFMLCEKALSGSGIEVKGEHILDPRTGLPATHHRDAWVCCASAALADALSTAFMVMSMDEVQTYGDSHPDVSALIVSQSSGEPTVHKIGKWE